MPFSGLTTRDDPVVIGEDVSEILRLISPQETPLLDLLPEPDEPAASTLHEWTEEELGPDYVVSSVAVSASSSTLAIKDHSQLLQTGMLLQNDATRELMQISSIHAMTGEVHNIELTRGYGRSTAADITTDAELFVVSTAEREGSETSGDVTRARIRRNNFSHIFKKPISLSDTRRAVITAPSVGDEYEHQVVNRTIELARDLEKAVIRSVKSASSMGSPEDTIFTMGGLQEFLSAIDSTITANSFAANPIDHVNDLLQQCWNTGARDLDLILLGHQWKRELSATNASQLLVTQDERGIERRVNYPTTELYLSLIHI